MRWLHWEDRRSCCGPPSWGGRFSARRLRLVGPAPLLLKLRRSAVVAHTRICAAVARSSRCRSRPRGSVVKIRATVLWRWRRRLYGLVIPCSDPSTSRAVHIETRWRRVVRLGSTVARAANDCELPLCVCRHTGGWAACCVCGVQCYRGCSLLGHTLLFLTTLDSHNPPPPCTLTHHTILYTTRHRPDGTRQSTVQWQDSGQHFAAPCSSPFPGLASASASRSLAERR